MNTNTNIDNSELQIQICNYLANILNQIDTKINLLSNTVNVIDNRLVIIEDKINSYQSNHYNSNLEPPKKIKKTHNIQNIQNIQNNVMHMDIQNNDNEDLELNYSGIIKQKITNARNEFELELLLSKEKEKWVHDFQLKQEIIEQHKLEWEKEQKELIEKDKQNTFLYLN
jgi:hypothetical protein